MRRTTLLPLVIHAQFAWPGPWQADVGPQNRRPDPSRADMVGQAPADIAELSAADD